MTVLAAALFPIITQGVPLPLQDDDSIEVPLPFSFPFCGTSYDSVFVGSNGYLTFGAGDTDFTESVPEMLADPPRIAPLWVDLNPALGGVVDASVVGPDFVVTFSGVPEFIVGGSNNFAVTLRPDGTFNMSYGLVTASAGLVGRTKGLGSFDVGEIDVTTAAQPISAPEDDLIYEQFTANDNDLSGADLEWAACTDVMPIQIVLLVIDEDSINNGIQSIEDISFGLPFCGGGDPAVCVNDDLANPGVRDILFSGATPFSGLVLPTGEVDDEGLFQFTNPDPQSSQQDDSISFTIQEFIFAVAGSDADDENNLDKINGVVPLGADDIAALDGKTVCAVVYDSDVSADVKDGYASLKGATSGLTAFLVTAVGADPEGSVLPSITVDLLPSADVETICGQVVPPPSVALCHGNGVIADGQAGGNWLRSSTRESTPH